MACWDTVGKALDRPVTRFGGLVNELRTPPTFIRDQTKMQR